jgi:L-cysteine S-thiosulfotransferase
MKHHLAILTCIVILQGCSEGPESARGFRLPDGSADMGRQAFEFLQCHACHDVQGVEPPAESKSKIDVRVALGGEVTRVKTYGELVTAIINPSHKLAPGYSAEDVSEDGKSLMEAEYLNEVMTVQELIDIVAFLQPKYEVRPPEYDAYRYTYH